MRRRSCRWLLLVGLALTAPAALAAAGAAVAATKPLVPIAGIDHVPTVVADLDAAVASYARLGFALKPGRVHDNGLRNQHVKFADGSGIELLSPQAGAVDALTRTYVQNLQQGQGPVFVSLHARDTGRLKAALDAAGIAHHDEDGALSLDDPALDFLFIGRDNRSPSDRPEHFAHANTAVAMCGLWLALAPPAQAAMDRLLRALGGPPHEGEVPVLPGRKVPLYPLNNGHVALLPIDVALLPGRPMVGAEFCLADPVQAATSLAAYRHGDATVPSYLVAPAQASGLWLWLHP